MESCGNRTALGPAGTPRPSCSRWRRPSTAEPTRSNVTSSASARWASRESPTPTKDSRSGTCSIARAASSPADPDAEPRRRHMSTVPRAHDLLVNTDMGDVVQPDWMVRVKEDYFKANESMFASRELGELLDEMDSLGVERAVLLTNLAKPSARAMSFVDAHPERFSLGIGGHNLLRPMENIRNLESF